MDNTEKLSVHTARVYCGDIEAERAGVWYCKGSGTPLVMSFDSVDKAERFSVLVLKFEKLCSKKVDEWEVGEKKWVVWEIVEAGIKRLLAFTDDEKEPRLISSREQLEIWLNDECKIIQVKDSTATPI